MHGNTWAEAEGAPLPHPIPELTFTDVPIVPTGFSATERVGWLDDGDRHLWCQRGRAEVIGLDGTRLWSPPQCPFVWPETPVPTGAQTREVTTAATSRWLVGSPVPGGCRVSVMSLGTASAELEHVDVPTRCDRFGATADGGTRWIVGDQQVFRWGVGDREVQSLGRVDGDRFELDGLGADADGNAVLWEDAIPQDEGEETCRVLRWEFGAWVHSSFPRTSDGCEAALYRRRVLQLPPHHLRGAWSASEAWRGRVELSADADERHLRLFSQGTWTEAEFSLSRSDELDADVDAREAQDHLAICATSLSVDVALIVDGTDGTVVWSGDPCPYPLGAATR
jgi:hypothetical protein